MCANARVRHDPVVLNDRAAAGTVKMSEEELRIRNRELERENAELREANNILKDALGFFAKDRKK